jgi:hypothetical protein
MAASLICGSLVHGGVGYGKQREELKRGVDVLVATPGRLLDLLEQRTMSLKEVKLLVLDEVDRMLDMGFLPDVRRIVEKISTDRQKGISEALHSSFLKDLRNSLSKALAKKNRVCILIDNLDKAWDKQSDIPSLTEFLLGLLKAASRISNDFRSVSATQQTVNVSLAVFIRADIFYRIMMIARERDKIPYRKLVWEDSEQLIRVLEERLVSSRATFGSPDAMRERFFEKEVRGLPVKEYLLSRIMHRPRDLLFFVKAATTTAVNRKHSKVTLMTF